MFGTLILIYAQEGGSTSTSETGTLRHGDTNNPKSYIYKMLGPGLEPMHSSPSLIIFLLPHTNCVVTLFDPGGRG
jgi:hypothetical protein